MSPTAPPNPAATDVPHLLALARLATPEAPPLDLYLAATHTLVQWQCAAPTTTLPALDDAAWRAPLEGFAHHYLSIYRHSPPDAAQRAVLDGAFATIVAQCQALPRVAVHGDCTPERVLLTGVRPMQFSLAATPAVAAGPVSRDIATLTRDARLLWDEAFTLDISIRYWDAARKAGLPVGDDFGEFYRGVEWTALHQHLNLLGERAHAAAQATLADGTPPALEDGRALMALVLSTCNRYIELKPLLRLIERCEGLEVPGGFAFGRI